MWDICEYGIFTCRLFELLPFPNPSNHSIETYGFKGYLVDKNPRSAPDFNALQARCRHTSINPRSKINGFLSYERSYFFFSTWNIRNISQLLPLFSVIVHSCCSNSVSGQPTGWRNSILQIYKDWLEADRLNHCVNSFSKGLNATQVIYMLKSNNPLYFVPYRAPYINLFF